MKQNSAYSLFGEPDFRQEVKSENFNVGSNNNFEINTLEWMKQNYLIENDVPFQLNSFGIIWIKNGSGSIKIDLEDYCINENMLVCISPRQLLKMCFTDNLCGFYISFSAEFLLMAEGQSDGSFMDILNERKNLTVIKPEKEMQNEMETVVAMMYKEFCNNGLMRMQVLKGLLKVFIIYLSGSMEVQEQENLNDRDSEMVRKFMILVKKQFLTKKMVSDYANELCVSPNYLNRIVKKISGFTASHHIQQLIVLEAKRQAMYSSLSMKEVAYFLGFNDYAHFSKFFKNNSGMNFTCFKSQVNQRA
jgi:AraC family transcriptional regulator, transcriptional activator of pobA